jgi:hypothetical protein
MGIHANYLKEPMPCDGCTHNAKCANKRLACSAFALYVHTGRNNWEIPRLPTKMTYLRIMFQQDNSLKNEIYKQFRLQEIA